MSTEHQNNSDDTRETNPKNAKEKNENYEKLIAEFEYKAEMKQLLNLIVHSLYTHPDIFIRELISNASDALNKLRFKRLTMQVSVPLEKESTTADTNIDEPDSELRIDIYLDKENSLFTISDNGIGMTFDDLINQIGTIARSGTLEFLQSISKGMEAQKNGKKSMDAQLIGKFGVGFYSVFMVTDEVTIETRFADKSSKAYKWISIGEEKYTIEECDKKGWGTRISFKLKDEYKEFSDENHVKEILKKYSNFVDFPIYVNNVRVNLVQALWHKSKDDIKEIELEEFYKFITNDYEKPAAHLYLAIEGNVSFKALIFIPKYAPPYFLREITDKSLQLYSSKIFIQDNCKELLPDYLKFVRGVVDTEDLPLNVSREQTQSSPIIAKIRNILTSKILAWLEDISKTKPDVYIEFYKNFSTFLKTGITSDFTNKDKIIELLCYETSLLEAGQITSLKEYISRMRDGQNAIYYISGESRTALERNPNLEYFKKNGIEVICLTEPVDIFTFPYIVQYDNKQLVSVEKADIDIDAQLTQSNSINSEIKDDAQLNSEHAKLLVETFKEILGDRVEDVRVSRRLIESPVTLVSGKQALDPQIEKMMKLFEKDYGVSVLSQREKASKRILEINISHQLIKNLFRIKLAEYKSPDENELLRNAILQLYDAALLREGMDISIHEFIERLYQFIEISTTKTLTT